MDRIESNEVGKQLETMWINKQQRLYFKQLQLEVAYNSNLSNRHR